MDFLLVASSQPSVNFEILIAFLMTVVQCFFPIHKILSQFIATEVFAISVEAHTSFAIHRDTDSMGKTASIAVHSICQDNFQQQLHNTAVLLCSTPWLQNTLRNTTVREQLTQPLRSTVVLSSPSNYGLVVQGQVILEIRE